MEGKKKEEEKLNANEKFDIARLVFAKFWRNAVEK